MTIHFTKRFTPTRSSQSFELPFIGEINPLVLLVLGAAPIWFVAKAITENIFFEVGLCLSLLAMIACGNLSNHIPRTLFTSAETTRGKRPLPELRRRYQGLFRGSARRSGECNNMSRPLAH